MKILMTGATGLLGRELGKALVRNGHQVVVVSRQAGKAHLECPFPCEVIEGDLGIAPLSSPLLEEVEAVIHLMGEPIAHGRWNASKKNRLVSTRVQATRHLRESFRKPPRILVSTSAVGFYGDRGEEVLTESSQPGSDFLAELCMNWEKEAFHFEKQGTRVVCFRLGAILSRRGGALVEVLTPARAGVAGPVGGGRQWMSWIHLQDAVGLYMKALEDSEMKGIYNAVAPRPVRNLEFMKALTAYLRRPGFLPLPSWGLKALFGEKSMVILSSQRASAEKIMTTGYVFQFHALEEVMEAELKELTEGDDVFEAEQYLSEPLEQVFSFFAEAKNLEKITPDFLNFKILSVSDPAIRSGTLIDYRLKIHGVPVRWRTQIEAWRPPFEFSDVQLKGPYQKWHHTHRFEAMGSGTLMVDQVRYRLPAGYLGWLGGHALVRRDVNQIFAYRKKTMSTKSLQMP